MKIAIYYLVKTLTNTNNEAKNQTKGRLVTSIKLFNSLLLDDD